VAAPSARPPRGTARARDAPVDDLRARRVPVDAAAERRERRLALTVVLVSAGSFLALRRSPAGRSIRFWAFIPVYESALVINDLVTAVLLFGQFGILRSRALRLYWHGLLFTAFMTSRTRSRPGLFAPTGLLGAGPQSTAWLYMFWHGGFPLLLIVYAMLEDLEHRGRSSAGAAAFAILGSVAAAARRRRRVHAAGHAGQSALPAIMHDNHYTHRIERGHRLIWGLEPRALGTLWRRRPHSVLDLLAEWSCCARGSSTSAWPWSSTPAVSTSLLRPAGSTGSLAASFVLVVLLLENGMLYARLVETHEGERREAPAGRSTPRKPRRAPIGRRASSCRG